MGMEASLVIGYEPRLWSGHAGWQEEDVRTRLNGGANIRGTLGGGPFGPCRDASTWELLPHRRLTPMARPPVSPRTPLPPVRHHDAVNPLRSGMPDGFYVKSGRKKTPDAYFQTLSAGDVTGFHLEFSPADRFWAWWKSAAAGAREG